MGFQDSLCFVCGVAATGGPGSFYASRRLNEAAQLIDAEFREAGLCEDVEDLQQVILGPFVTLFNGKELPKGMGRKAYSATWIGLGYWSEDGQPRFYRSRSGQSLPDGRDVEVRRLRGAEGYCGQFNRIVEDRAEGEEYEDDYDDEEDDERDEEEKEAQVMEKNVAEDTVCDPDEGSAIFLCENCYHYLEAWLDTAGLPARSHAFPDDPEDMPFAGELYEIVSSQARGAGGLLPDFEYDGIEGTLEQRQDSIFPGCWQPKGHLAKAIQGGLRDAALVPALLRDGRAWMFTRPDMCAPLSHINTSIH
ncbi:hypothetical protein PHLGIDRAFT_448054 [Phlebiopsis gigantea 11061_1 CR5-6]|uniref:Uncharacterized protein n=1 Tax=Phlebiopsis gigantea (strain 11061_1 CR5-6) TaxID=745531 RepID=A0A0C3SA20_PHLG1|nr:hypothetical protein PHLGIDRAFT_448054 [Phlebiopsis gigantea 11061_1 CR5-6]